MAARKCGKTVPRLSQFRQVNADRELTSAHQSRLAGESFFCDALRNTTRYYVAAIINADVNKTGVASLLILQVDRRGNYLLFVLDGLFQSRGNKCGRNQIEGYVAEIRGTN